ncbi:MAG: topoisomerase IV, partial [Lachnospiraceae bacterium]|nr:topoisomerase IV [Lachnospiraceae bacterium]
MEISKLLLSNYLPYAKSTIISRAIPSIDGLKPVQRRLLYTMYKLGLLTGDRSKSQKINGATMSIHPHGDSSIYETMVLMSSGYEGMNVPYVDSKGSFGKVYSRDLKYSAPRYTEAKLAKICNEIFDGIHENAVEFIPNFDDTETEPSLLPVKFPSILVNTSSGVAVGTSSSIPSFSLKNVCLATQGILNDTIKTPGELAKVLGAPEFTTGGFLHADEASLEKLCATGKGSFTISGHVEVYSNQIIIDEIPYTTTAEDVMDAIDEHMKNNELKGVKNVRDEIGLEGLRIVIEIKSGYNSREVLQELCRVTPLRHKISFKTRVIVADRCRDLNLLEVLQTWVEFRQECIKRVYQFRLDKDTVKEHLLATWEKIKHDIPGVVQMIS